MDIFQKWKKPTDEPGEDLRPNSKGWDLGVTPAGVRLMTTPVLIPIPKASVPFPTQIPVWIQGGGFKPAPSQAKPNSLKGLRRSLPKSRISPMHHCHKGIQIMTEDTSELRSRLTRSV